MRKSKESILQGAVVRIKQVPVIKSSESQVKSCQVIQNSDDLVQCPHFNRPFAKPHLQQQLSYHSVETVNRADMLSISLQEAFHFS